MLDEDWYHSVEGEYRGVPTWGPRTESVEWQIGASHGDGDIVSWDTRDADREKHLFLRRTWAPAMPDGQKHLFHIATYAEMEDEDDSGGMSA